MKKSEIEKFHSYRKKVLSQENNTVDIQPEALLTVALVFPNTYEIGMSNLGFHALYRMFNCVPGVRCERAFLYPQFPEMTRTLETNQELSNFDIVAFSISFELDIPNIVKILINSGISAFSENRNPHEPLVIAGGAVTFLNPCPLDLFVDIFFLGEIEHQFDEIIHQILESRKHNLSKFELFDILKHVAGLYIPQIQDKHSAIAKLLTPIKSKPQYSVITSSDSHFKNMFLVEVGRGCGRRCNFCAASHIYHPYRTFPMEDILALIDEHATDTNRIGLVGAALSDYDQLVELCEILVGKGYELGLSSFRLDMITPEFLKILEKGKVQTLTFAPEAGSESLRKKIHKNLSDVQIFRTVEHIANSKINQLKLYFLIGLPGETDDDIDAIIKLIDQIYQEFKLLKKRKTLSVSVNTFIPKPFTPFQWSAMETVKEIKRKRKQIERSIVKIPNVSFSRKNVKDEVLQGILSLGGSEVGNAILYKVKNNTEWQEAWDGAGIDVDSILYRQRTFEEVLPWDFIETGIMKEILWKRWIKATEQ